LLLCSLLLFAAADIRTWFAHTMKADVELWVATTPLTADDVKGWLVASRIKMLMQKQRMLTQVTGSFACSVPVCESCCCRQTER
jgi:hypothetical protein